MQQKWEVDFTFYLFYTRGQGQRPRGQRTILEWAAPRPWLEKPLPGSRGKSKNLKSKSKMKQRKITKYFNTTRTPDAAPDAAPVDDLAFEYRSAGMRWAG